MKVAYFDCFSGISGDMAIGALLDAGLDINILSRELRKLKIKGYKIAKRIVKRGEIAGTKFDVLVENRGHAHRTLKDVLALIEKSSLSRQVKETSKAIFTGIGKAEAKIHRKHPVTDVDFHEIGAIDSIIDIVGLSIAIESLGIDEIHSSNILMGRAVVDTRHGVLPVPSPASLELLKGVPVEISGIDAELVTPTGAGILKALSKGYGPMPRMTISSIGYGAGTRDLSGRTGIPNMLRVIIGQRAGVVFGGDRVYVIETNIDDMNPQAFEYLFERLLNEGALDVYTTVIQMKKSRPAFKLTALVKEPHLNKMASVIFEETTAIGVRFYEAERYKLERKIMNAKTGYGTVKVKVSTGPGNISTISPEYDTCVSIARKKKVPLKLVMEAAKRTAALVSLIVFMILAIPRASADVIYTKDGKELRGIVVEEYKDRLTLSTVDGEINVMKPDIQELYYDSDEDNLIKLAEQSLERADHIRAFAYYDRAFKLNPESKRAKDGIVFLQGYLFRKEQAQKENVVKRQQEFEDRMTVPEAAKSPDEESMEGVKKLKEAIGLGLAMNKNFPEVVYVKPVSPAYVAGLKKGDLIVAVWGKLTGYMSLDDVIDNILEKSALEIKCTIERRAKVPFSENRTLLSSTNDLIGVTFTMEFDGLTVSGAREDGAAFASGIRPMDLVIAIDGKSTRYMPLKKAVELIKGSKEDAVFLTIRREVTLWRE